MSEHEITVVRLDLLSQDGAISLADAVTAWLKTAGIIAKNDRHPMLIFVKSLVEGSFAGGPRLRVRHMWHRF